jgi:ribosomal protein S18 acetylase RimI-like enzyme
VYDEGYHAAMHIRVATSQDTAALAAMNLEFNESSATPEQMAAQIEAARGHETALIAEVDGATAGFACLRVLRCVCYAEPYAEVTEMYVRPAHRRKGVGRALMLFAEQLAREAGAHEIKVLTGADNDQGQGLYRSLGYEVDDEVLLLKPLS